LSTIGQDGSWTSPVQYRHALKLEQYFESMKNADLEKRGEYFGTGTAADKETAQRLYGIVNVGPPLKL